MKTRRNTVDIKDIEKLKASLEDKPDEELNNNSMSEEELEERCNLLEKYGLKEMEESDVEELLGTKKSNVLDNKELENMERVLSKNIYNSINSLPSIKKASVEVFVENDDELYGIVNTIIECAPGSFLGRIMGSSSKENIYYEAIETAQNEIMEYFDSCPEVVNNFQINVEFF